MYPKSLDSEMLTSRKLEMTKFLFSALESINHVIIILSTVLAGH